MTYDDWVDAVAEAEFTGDERNRRISGQSESPRENRSIQKSGPDSTEILVANEKAVPIAPVEGLTFSPVIEEVKKPQVLYEEVRQYIRRNKTW